MSPELHEEIELELTSLGQLFERYGSLLEAVQTRAPDDVEILALGAILNSFYGAVENIFTRAAIHLDGSCPQGESWHRDLLNAMASASKQRAPLISEDLHAYLADLLAFRHFYRHAYAFRLDWERMVGLVSQCQARYKQIESELRAYLGSTDG